MYFLHVLFMMPSWIPLLESGSISICMCMYQCMNVRLSVRAEVQCDVLTFWAASSVDWPPSICILYKQQTGSESPLWVKQWIGCETFGCPKMEMPVLLTAWQGGGKLCGAPQLVALVCMWRSSHSACAVWRCCGEQCTMALLCEGSGAGHT